MNQESEIRSRTIRQPEAISSVRVIVFDMDGTLYQLDGKDNGYSGSSLEKAVLENATTFVCQKEYCSRISATDIIQKGVRDEIGLSSYLGKRYEMTREEYFSSVWDIDPKGIVSNFEESVGIVKAFASSGLRLVLLTSAPKIWQDRVFEYLGLKDCFAAIYTAEDFGNKVDIFQKLLETYDASSVLSVGDQIATDIEPAKRLGMETFLVTDVGDMAKLPEAIGGVYE